jgi:ribosome-binding ATPase
MSTMPLIRTLLDLNFSNIKASERLQMLGGFFIASFIISAILPFVMLSIGIIGLPNVGKSTLFNALLKKQVALSANYPFATIEPNVGIVDVPDVRLEQLVETIQKEHGTSDGLKEIPQKVVPAVVKFVDIAGLVKGAHEGEGLGNKFLSNIREVDAIVHVIRDFEDENISRAGSSDPESDREVIETELLLSDISHLEKTLEKNTKLARTGDKDCLKRINVVDKLLREMGKGTLAVDVTLDDKELEIAKQLNLLTLKPFLHVYNQDEKAFIAAKNKASEQNTIHLCARLEEELAQLSEKDEMAMMNELGIHASGLDRVIKRGYDILNLQTFFTAGPKEVRAWTIPVGIRAPQAAGTIHTDFERGFISAEVTSFKDYVSCEGRLGAKEKGLLRIEGKNYVVQDGDVVEFRFSV